ncbi:MAG: hypothetical protein JSU61_03465 [Fidelibacterota bacterium]|nr:MAG: hypothetical protein JSU61_03465 [Candidatus Neomarinimicrobiota bacterium]
MILIIEKDIPTVETMRLLLQALDQPFEVVNTHSKAALIYNIESVSTIFFNPELPMVDPKALIDELEGIAMDKNKPRAPIIFLYSDDEIVRRYELHQIPDSEMHQKPVTMEQFYGILDGFGLTELQVNIEHQQVKEKLRQFSQFIHESEGWLDRLKNHLVKE